MGCDALLSDVSKYPSLNLVVALNSKDEGTNICSKHRERLRAIYIMCGYSPLRDADSD